MSRMTASVHSVQEGLVVTENVCVSGRSRRQLPPREHAAFHHAQPACSAMAGWRRVRGV